MNKLIYFLKRKSSFYNKIHQNTFSADQNKKINACGNVDEKKIQKKRDCKSFFEML